MNAPDLIEHALDLLLAKDMAAFAGLWPRTAFWNFRSPRRVIRPGSRAGRR